MTILILCFPYNISKLQFVPLFLIPKEALNENIKESETSLHLPSSTHDQSDNPETEGMKTCTDVLSFYIKVCSLHLDR